MDPESRKSGVLTRGAWIGTYEILGKLATGGMAEIYLARITGAGGFEKLVVLKCILPSVAEDERFVEMFLDEARLAASLHHPNLADVYDVGHEGSTYYYAMEFVHGQDVRTIRAEAKHQQQQVPIRIATSIILGVAAALDYAHDRTAPDGSPLDLVHRDVAASNVMVSYEGAIKLVDFGIARARSLSRRTEAGIRKGKVPYMSPEQCQGLELDRRSDLFSLGVVLYELTVGRRPFRGDSRFVIMDKIVHGRVPAPTSLVASYPTELNAIVMRLLESEPANRYATAGELIHDLERFIAKYSLWQSPRAVSDYMRTLFAERFAAWEEAEREGVPFAQRVVQSISPNSVVTPLTPSPTEAPAGPASQPFAAVEPLEGSAETPEPFASLLGASAMGLDEAEAPLAVVQPTNIAHPPPIEAVKTSVTPAPFMPESLSAPVEPHDADLSTSAPATRSRASQPQVPSDFLNAPADPADALATTVSPAPFAATIQKDEPKVPTEFTDVRAESGTMRTAVPPPPFASTIPAVTSALPFAASSRLDEEDDEADAENADRQQPVVSALESLESDLDAPRPENGGSEASMSTPAESRAHPTPTNEEAEARGRKAAQARARQASQQQEDARREAREQAEAVRKATQAASRVNTDGQHEEESVRRASARTQDARQEDAYQQAKGDAVRQQPVAEARRESQQTAPSSNEEAGEEDKQVDVGAPIARAAASSAAAPPVRAVPSAPTAFVYPTLAASKATKLVRILLLLLVLFGAGVLAYLAIRAHTTTTSTSVPASSSTLLLQRPASGPSRQARLREDESGYLSRSRSSSKTGSGSSGSRPVAYLIGG